MLTMGRWPMQAVRRRTGALRNRNTASLKAGGEGTRLGVVGNGLKECGCLLASKGSPTEDLSLGTELL